MEPLLITIPILLPLSHRGIAAYLGWVQAYMHWALADCHSHSYSLWVIPIPFEWGVGGTKWTTRAVFSFPADSVITGALKPRWYCIGKPSMIILGKRSYFLSSFSFHFLSHYTIYIHIYLCLSRCLSPNLLSLLSNSVSIALSLSLSQSLSPRCKFNVWSRLDFPVINVIISPPPRRICNCIKNPFTRELGQGCQMCF